MVSDGGQQFEITLVLAVGTHSYRIMMLVQAMLDLLSVALSPSFHAWILVL